MNVPLRGEYRFLIENLTNKDVITDAELIEEIVEFINDMRFAINELGFGLNSKPVQEIYLKLKPLLPEAQRRGWKPGAISVAFFGLLEASETNTTEN